MYIQLISIHGLIRGESIEMGRDSDTGGQVRYVVELARTLSKFDEVTQVDLFTRQIRDKRVSTDYGQRIEQLSEQCRIVRLPCGGGKYVRKERLWPHLDEFADAMIAFTRREGRVPAVVHGHYADAGYIAREVASAFGAPFVFTGHSLGRDKWAYLQEQGWTMDTANRELRMETRIEAEERSLRSADLVVASTTHERDTQYARYESGKTPTFAIIPPGTGLERFFPFYEYELAPDNVDESFKQARMRMMNELGRFHFSQDKPVILALCRPDKRKNIGALIKAYGENNEIRALANLAIFAGIRKDIEELGEAEREVLTDILLMMDRYDLYGSLAIPKRHDSEREVPELYRLVASGKGIFVNPAFVEPFGLTFIEASAVGLPFVGTENGGPQDIVANCESGILVNVNDKDTLANAIKKLLTDHDLWQKCSNNGINRVREHYTWETHCSTYLEKLKEVTSSTQVSTVLKPDAQAAPAKRLGNIRRLLITDIDNTLIGNEEAVERLKHLLEQNRDQLGFGVATGRYFEDALRALDDYNIGPVDVVVSSVGTEIYYGPDYEMDKGWASHLRVKWRPDRIREALSQLDFLSLQKDEATQREFKISYDLDSEVDHETALAEIHHALSTARASYSLVFSHGTYVDVLSYRASKGKAIRYLSGKWNIPLEYIATAGDSGNDKDMLTGRTAGIVVGNYSEELEVLKNSPSTRIFYANSSYADGIIEGLDFFGFLESTGPTDR